MRAYVPLATAVQITGVRANAKVRFDGQQCDTVVNSFNRPALQQSVAARANVSDGDVEVDVTCDYLVPDGMTDDDDDYYSGQRRRLQTALSVELTVSTWNSDPLTGTSKPCVSPPLCHIVWHGGNGAVLLPRWM